MSKGATGMGGKQRLNVLVVDQDEATNRTRLKDRADQRRATRSDALSNDPEPSDRGAMKQRPVSRLAMLDVSPPEPMAASTLLERVRSADSTTSASSAMTAHAHGGRLPCVRSSVRPSIIIQKPLDVQKKFTR